MSLFKTWKDCETGATAIEYALIAGTISIAILVAVTSVGTSLNAIFQELLAGF
jgi:pilus assembly protein Flp/PilA